MNELTIIFFLPLLIVLIYTVIFFTRSKFKLSKYVLIYAEIWHLVLIPYMFLGIEWNMPYSDKFGHFLPEDLLTQVTLIIIACVTGYFLFKIKQNPTRPFLVAILFLLLMGLVLNLWMWLKLEELWFFFNLPIVLLFGIAIIKVIYKLLMELVMNMTVNLFYYFE